MTTREENLKKINDELEKLDDEELDHVTGGVFRGSYSLGFAGGVAAGGNEAELKLNQRLVNNVQYGVAR